MLQPSQTDSRTPILAPILRVLHSHQQAWAALPPSYRAILRAAWAEAGQEMLASYDAKNAKAMASVISKTGHPQSDESILGSGLGWR
jgi:TRAP-type mannitol/chloroaromatic compound transport system substrate-binding protein